MNTRFAIYTALLTVTLLLIPINRQTTLAKTCASKCPPAPLRFTPGKYIRVQVVNRSYGQIKLEQLPELRKKTLKPGEKYQFDLEGEQWGDFSLMFWDDGGRHLKAVVLKPNFGTLLLEIRSNSGNYQGDRSVYLRSDGQVGVL
ncbi:MAG: hypothetical protein ACKO11_02990 [Cuspidothrix sp.]